MTNEIDVTPYDATLLVKVCKERGVTAEALANRSGYDDKSIYRYFAGERTIPSTVFRAAFELSHDLRLLGLITGTVPIAYQVARFAPAGCPGNGGGARPEPVRIPPVEQLLSETCDALKHVADAITYMEKILRDGRLDDTDRNAVDKFKRHSADSRRLLATVDAALEAHLAKGGAA